MKKTISIAFAAFALLSFASCQKENLTSENQEPVLRTITATFENNGTKTTLSTDDVTPLWEENDVIRVLDRYGHEDIKLEANNIKNDGKTITFTTSLSGTLYAVYPASATTMEDCYGGSIDFTIPFNQDGTFASANICVAKGDKNDNLVFSNATSILEFSQTADETKVLRVAVTAANAIAGKLTATFGADNKATISTEELTGKIIWTSAPATAQDKYYVAIAPVNTGAVNFKYYNENLKEASEDKNTNTLARNKIYELTIPTNGYDENSYVEIGGKKWAKYNIGATTIAGSYTTCYGDLYEWGSVETIYKERPWTSASAGNFTNKWKTGKTNGYSWTTYCGNSSFVEWNPIPYDDKNILKSEKDAATQNWGAGWRMPTKDDFVNLTKDCRSYSSGRFIPSTATTAVGVSSKGVYYCSNYSDGDGIKGLLFFNGTNKLFFPAAGYSNSSTSLFDAASLGYYWSSSLYTSTSSKAYYMYFGNPDVGAYPVEYTHRYYGVCVRPVVSDQ